MPLYNYNCGCGKCFSAWAPMAESASPALCPRCNQLAPRGVSAPRISSDYAGYTCPVSGKWIEGRAAHEENLRRTGCRILEPGETESSKATRAREDADLDRSVEETVEKLFDAMPSDKRERLGAELESGVTATVERL